MAGELSPFFGDLSGSSSVEVVKNNPYYQNTHELPDAYVGRNHFLMSTLDYLITKEGRDFLTKVILPYEHTDNTNVAWEVFHFDRSIVDIEPEQGVPQFITMKHDVRSNTLVRRGLAFQIEHGFFNTDIGRRHYTMNIQQIVDAVEETTALQALITLVDTPDYYENNRGGDDWGKLELRRFGIVQRGEGGMHLLDADLKDLMLRQNIRPTAYVMPPRAMSYINMRDPYMTEYKRGGRGVEALEVHADTTFRGTRVYESRYFETDYVSEPYDPLTQVITYAEWYPATDVWVFSMDKDDWVKVTGAVMGAAALSAVGSSPFMPQGLGTLSFRRFKGVKDEAEFVSKFLPTVEAAHRDALMAHLATLDDGSVVRPNYITEFLETLK
jgi:hypothetical protein